MKCFSFVCHFGLFALPMLTNAQNFFECGKLLAQFHSETINSNLLSEVINTRGGRLILKDYVPPTNERAMGLLVSEPLPTSSQWLRAPIRSLNEKALRASGITKPGHTPEFISFMNAADKIVNFPIRKSSKWILGKEKVLAEVPSFIGSGAALLGVAGHLVVTQANLAAFEAAQGAMFDDQMVEYLLEHDPRFTLIKNDDVNYPDRASKKTRVKVYLLIEHKFLKYVTTKYLENKSLFGPEDANSIMLADHPEFLDLMPRFTRALSGNFASAFPNAVRLPNYEEPASQEQLSELIQNAHESLERQLFIKAYVNDPGLSITLDGERRAAIRKSDIATANKLAAQIERLRELESDRFINELMKVKALGLLSNDEVLLELYKDESVRHFLADMKTMNLVGVDESNTEYTIWSHRIRAIAGLSKALKEAQAAEPARDPGNAPEAPGSPKP